MYKIIRTLRIQDLFGKTFDTIIQLEVQYLHWDAFGDFQQVDASHFP